MTKVKKNSAPKAIASIIRAAMGAKSINQVQLAKLTGVCQETISNDLSDPAKIRLDRLFIYFAALGLPTNCLIEQFANSLANTLKEI